MVTILQELLGFSISLEIEQFQKNAEFVSLFAHYIGSDWLFATLVQEYKC